MRRQESPVLLEYLFQADPKAKEIDEEFEQYQKKLKEQKDAWAKEHPDEVPNLATYQMDRIKPTS